MLGGYYTIASGMMVQQRKLEVQGNNMVNSQTPGFHAQRVVASAFEQELVSRIEHRNTETIGNANPITIVETVSTQTQTGTLKQTGRSMDVAINGGGYYAIPGADNVTYLTRNGGFDIDDEGYLVLPDVGRVQGTNGPIQVGDTNFTVRGDGTVLNSEGETAGTLQTVLPPEGTELTQYNNGLFGVPSDTQFETQTASFMQNYLELSNVDLNREYTMLMEAQSSFTACSTALQIIDQINQKSAAQIASL